MRLVSFLLDDDDPHAPLRTGVLDGDTVVDLHLAAASTPLATPEAGLEMTTLLGAGERGEDLIRSLMASSASAARFPATACRLHAPVPTPPKLVCAGVNYRGVAAAVDFRAGEGPPIFLKATSTVVGSAEEIVLPPAANGPVLLEVELGVVIGTRARHLSVDTAYEAVAGYTTLLDLTAQTMLERDAYRFASAGDQPPATHIVLFRAKDYDTFTPTGPSLLTRSELADEQVGSLPVSATVNGTLQVDGNTADMLVTVPELLAYISSVMTLVPGDVVATGHPGNVVARPLEPGDAIEARIGPLDPLRIRVAQDRAPAPAHPLPTQRREPAR